MEPTLKKGETLVLSRGLTPARGDVVTVEAFTDEGEAAVKRVLALPGDTISCPVKGGAGAQCTALVVNGQRNNAIKRRDDVPPR